MADSSFLASPDEILDWRRVVLSASAIRNGLFAPLPGTEGNIAVRSGLAVHTFLRDSGPVPALFAVQMLLLARKPVG